MRYLVTLLRFLWVCLLFNILLTYLDEALYGGPCSTADFLICLHVSARENLYGAAVTGCPTQSRRTWCSESPETPSVFA
jgi:hypothetical protein